MRRGRENSLSADRGIPSKKALTFAKIFGMTVTYELRESLFVMGIVLVLGREFF